MKKVLSLLLCGVILLSCTLWLSGCLFRSKNPYPYQGEHKALYTAAIYSIPDAKGYMSHGEGAYSADIYIWEQDSYGRTLFSYCEDYGNQIFALVIAQASDEANVYFYPDSNYALTFLEAYYVYEAVEDDHLKQRTEAFYLEAGDALKAQNDWEQPLDQGKCVSYPITDHKTPGEKADPLSAARCNEILNHYSGSLGLPNPDPAPHSTNRVLQVDAEGRVLHEICGHYDAPDQEQTDAYTHYDITLWVITDAKGNYDKEKGILVMYSKANETDHSFVYRAEDILEFKQQNDWVYPGE